MNSKYESINIGDQAELKHKVTTQDVLDFVKLTGDDNKLHLDKDYAKNTIFKKPVVHGMLGGALISTIIGTKLPGDGALWYHQSIDFLLPVRVGDVLTIKAIVLKKNDRDNSIELSTNIYNQNHQKVTAGISKVKVIELIEKKSSIKEAKARSKTALIIGSTGGIGESTALKLADDGFNVILHYYKNITSANQICDKISNSKIKKLIVGSDIGNKNEVEDMFTKIYRKFDSVDVIVNCSTISFGNIKFENMDWNNIQNHIDINIKGTFNIIKQAMPMMIKNKYGKIINITTQYVDDPKTELLHYITAKSALEGFSRALALELAPKGIRVNLISPGMTDTDLISDVPEKTKMVTAAQTPLRKLATPIDIANSVSFLASKESDFITGETIRVNGGQVMK